MASNSISINVVGINGKALTAAQDMVVNAQYCTVSSITQGVAGALCTVAAIKGPASQQCTNYNVTDTMAAVLAKLNQDTVADLSVVGTLDVTGRATFDTAIVRKNTNTSVASGGSITAAQLAGGMISFTGAVGALALPTATNLATELGAAAGTTFDFVLHNIAGTGTCTLTVGAGTTAVSAVTGGTTLTLADSATAGVAGFRYTFISATVAILSRLY